MQNPILAVMKCLGLPETREQYLEMAYLERRPYVTAEEDSELPAEFQDTED